MTKPDIVDLIVRLLNFPLSANQYFPLCDLSLPEVPDVVGVLAEEDVHDGGDQHVDEDEDDEGVELAGSPVQGKQLSSGQVRSGTTTRWFRCSPEMLEAWR